MGGAKLITIAHKDDINILFATAIRKMNRGAVQLGDRCTLYNLFFVESMRKAFANAPSEHQIFGARHAAVVRLASSIATVQHISKGLSHRFWWGNLRQMAGKSVEELQLARAAIQILSHDVAGSTRRDNDTTAINGTVGQLSFSSDSCCWMRLIDDGLFITTNLHEAERFSSSLQSKRVASEYGTRLNAKKSHLDPASNQESVVWCALRIETDTLDCSWDFDRLYRIPLKDTLTVSGSFADKMRLYVQARCIPLVLTTLSSVSSLLVHLAHKLVAYAGQLPHTSPALLIRAVEQTRLHVSRLTRFPLEAHALGVGAFEGVMRRHGGRWRGLTRWLTRHEKIKRAGYGSGAFFK